MNAGMTRHRVVITSSTIDDVGITVVTFYQYIPSKCFIFTQDYVEYRYMHLSLTKVPLRLA